MTVPARFSLAFTLGFSLLPTAYGGSPDLPGQEPAPLAIRPNNQDMAERIAAHLRQSSRLQRYDVNVRFHDGSAELTGSVADAEQRGRVLRLVEEVPGVQRIVDRLSIASGIVPVQAAIPETLPPVSSTNTVQPPVPPVATAPVPPAPGAAPAEATPIFQAPAAAPYQLNPPRMPPYAWPTYAPYNNYSRVGYPLAYPYNAFPFIGPVYPFPKVPLGWRSVRLEWDDGFWWFSKTATRWDWWKLRYY